MKARFLWNRTYAFACKKYCKMTFSAPAAPKKSFLKADLPPAGGKSAFKNLCLCKMHNSYGKTGRRYRLPATYNKMQRKQVLAHPAKTCSKKWAYSAYS
jgi:hypothetical protein